MSSVPWVRVGGALFERTDEAQVEHLGWKRKRCWRRQRLRIPSVTIHPVGMINALGLDAPAEGGNGA